MMQKKSQNKIIPLFPQCTTICSGCRMKLWLNVSF